MKVLITGGLGYVGGRIAAFLAMQNDIRVTITTRKSNEAINTVIFPATVRIITQVSDYATVFNDPEESYDVVIHLAALNEIDCQKYPYIAAEVNVLHSYRLLEFCIQKKVKRFIYFSTAHVYGTPLTGVINEHKITRPIYPYAVTHRAFEDFVTAAHDQGKIEAMVLRLSNSFGPPAFDTVNRWSLLVNDLCKQAIEKQHLRLISSGLQQRDFITLTDVCRAVVHFLHMPTSLLDNGIFNLGGNNGLKVMDMAKLIQERFEKITGGFIPIYAASPTSAELNNDLSIAYSIDKLLSTGFQLINPMEWEIDNMLVFCQNTFSK